MNRSGFFILILLQCNFLIAQNLKVDSLINVLDQKELTGEERVKIYNSIAYLTRKTDTAIANSYNQKAIELSQRIGYIKGQLDAYSRRAYQERVNENFRLAIDYYKKIIDLSINTSFTDELANAYQGLGITYSYVGEYSLGTNNLLKAVDLRSDSEDEKDKASIARAYNNLGLIQEKLGNYPKAIEYYTLSLKMKDQAGDKKGMAISYNNIGNIYNRQEDYSEAAKYYNQSITIKQELDDQHGLAISYLNLGSVIQSMGDYSSAKDYFKRSLAIRRDLNQKNSIAYCLSTLGNVYLKEGKYDSALFVLEEALEEPIITDPIKSNLLILLGKAQWGNKNYQKSRALIKEGVNLAEDLEELESIAFGLKALAQTEESLGNYKAAFDAQQGYQIIADSLQNEDNIKKIARIEANYEFEKERDSLTFAQVTERVAYESEIKQRSTIQNATYIVLFISIVLLVLIIIFYRTQRKNNLRLSLLNEEINKQNLEIIQQRDQLKNALSDLEKAQLQLIQSEKLASIGSLSTGIGHEINNPLNFIKGGVTGISSIINEKQPGNQDLSRFIQIVNEGVDRASEVVKSLSNFSKPGEENEVSDCDIKEMITQALVLLYNQTKERINVNEKYENGSLVVSGNLNRLQQVFMNVLLNAVQSIQDSGTIDIEVYTDRSSLITKIKDSGVGINSKYLKKVMDPFFTTKPPNEATGLGLSMAYKIVNEHEGTIKLESELNQGTTVIISLPLSGKPN